MKLSDLKKYGKVTIQCHDNPDADTISSGYGLYCYYENNGCETRIVYSGNREIQKRNLKMMIEYLGIPISYIPPSERKKLEGVLITVDCQYGAGNVTTLEADYVACIDHHLQEVTNIKDIRIQPHLGSCATLVWSMLKEEQFPAEEDINLGTALYYGLYMDTNQFSELYNPLDMDMIECLSVDTNLMKKLRNSNISLEEFDIASVAMSQYKYDDKNNVAIIAAPPCDQNILGIISDFLIQVDAVDTSLVYSDTGDGYRISVRSCVREVKANELAIYLTDGIGSGGGRHEKAGGFINERKLTEKYPMQMIQRYLWKRIEDYFSLFKLLYADELAQNIQDMPQYIRRKNPLCYLYLDDIAKGDDQITLRTVCVNQKVDVYDGLYCVIEQDGVIHLLNRERFHLYFNPLEEHITQEYWENKEYIPIIRNWEENQNYQISQVGKIAMPTDEFRIYAFQLDSYVKLFHQKEDEERYLLGKPGDYIVISYEEPTRMFIEPKEKFSKRFREI